MIAITRGRIVAAAGILSLSGLVGAAVAMPGPWHDVKTATQQQDAHLASVPGPWDDGIKLASVPAPWDDGIQLMSFHEGTRATYEG